MFVEPLPPHIRLRKLVIRKCRNVRPTTLEFDDDWNILLGKNGAGKTTLLRLLQTLFATTPVRREIPDHDVEVTLSRPDIDIDVVAHSFRGPESASTEQAPIFGSLPDSMRSRVDLTVNRRGTELGRASKIENKIRFETRGKFFEGLAGDGLNIESFAEIAIQHCTGARMDPRRFFRGLDRFDEALESFAVLSEQAEVTAIAFTIANGERWGPAGFGDRPETGAAAIANRTIETIGDRIELTHLTSAPLQRACSLMGFQGARFEYTLHSREERNIVYRVSRLEFHGPHDSVTPHEHLSFGQKRLVAFLFYLDAHPEIVLADELTNGLHYDWIKQLIEWMDGRQKFVAAQNPLMIDRVGFSSSESVRRRFIRCERQGSDAVLRQFTEAESAEFFETYQAGAQLVSELLRQQGLW